MKNKGVHKLIKWDRCVRQDDRPQGMFSIRLYSIHKMQQQLLGNLGEDDINYIVTGEITIIIPLHLDGL